MTWLLVGSGILAIATGIVVLVVGVVRGLCGVRRAGRLRRALLIGLVSLPVHAMVTMPLALGFLGSHFVGTRPDERGYEGPRIGTDGGWLLQSRASLLAEREGRAVVDPGILDAARARAAHFTAADGTPLRAFVVAPRVPAPRATVVMVHGLFRCAVELETVGAMFRDLDCEVVMLELRNHGGSGRATPTFGLHEAQDVRAAVAWARSRSPVDAARPLLLFGVSLGTAAVGIAAPDVERLAGLVLDAPMDDALETAHRMFEGDAEGRRRFTFVQPFRSLVLTSVELWTGIRLADVRPIDALARLRADVAVLVIGGGRDDRMPPAEVRDVFAALPVPAARKTLWIHDDAGHGDVWTIDPVGYREHLAALLDLAAPR